MCVPAPVAPTRAGIRRSRSLPTASRSRHISPRTAFEAIHVVIPARPQRPRGAILRMDVSETEVPGPNDSRALGVMLDELRIAPAGHVWPPAVQSRVPLAGAAAFGAAIALLASIPAALAGAVAIGGRTGSAAVPRIRPLHRVPGRGSVAGRVDRARGCRHRLVERTSRHTGVGSGPLRRRILRGRAVPEAARAAPPADAGRGRDVPCPPVPGRARRQPLLHVDRAGKLYVSRTRRASTCSPRSSSGSSPAAPPT